MSCHCRVESYASFSSLSQLVRSRTMQATNNKKDRPEQFRNCNPFAPKRSRGSVVAKGSDERTNQRVLEVSYSSLTARILLMRGLESGLRGAPREPPSAERHIVDHKHINSSIVSAYISQYETPRPPQLSRASDYRSSCAPPLAQSLQARSELVAD